MCSVATMTDQNARTPTPTPSYLQLRISVSRPEKDWKNKCIRDSVGCMMGFYLMAGSKPNRNQAIFHEVCRAPASSFHRE